MKRKTRGQKLNESIGIVWVGLIFLAIHFLDDYFLQIFFSKIFEKLNVNYSKRNWQGLSFHCLCYIIGFVPVFWWLHINFLWLILLFGLHYLIDGYLRFWKNTDSYYPLSRFLRDIIKSTASRKINLIKDAFKRARFQIIDQLFHFLILGIILIFF